MLLEFSISSNSRIRAFQSATMAPMMTVLYSLCKTARKTSLRIIQAVTHYSSALPILPCHSVAASASRVVAAAHHHLQHRHVNLCVSRRGASEAPVIFDAKNMVWVYWNCVLCSASWLIVGLFKFIFNLQCEEGALSEKSRIIYFIHEDMEAMTHPGFIPKARPS